MQNRGKRIANLQERMRENGIDCVVVYKPENRRYLSGFTGSTGFLILTGDEAIFATDFRYQEQVKNECAACSIRIIDNEYTLFSLLQDMRPKVIGLEEDWASLTFHDRVCKAIPDIRVAYVEGFVKEQRMKKDEEEVELLKTACAITDEAFEKIIEVIKPGMSEREISTEIQYYMKQRGAEATPDTFIIATGPRASLPHGKATDRTVEAGDFITMDIGCKYKGYWSDMTRTVVLGRAAERQREIYGIVAAAQAKVTQLIRPGMTGWEADELARDFITRAGYGKEFGHGLGHGLGMEMHEAPRLAQSEAGKVSLEPGMVVTNEPGIYIEGFGGVRIEDDLLIRREGCEVLCCSPRELIEIAI
jgi:Xaa-Pro aminopeptidase